MINIIILHYLHDIWREPTRNDLWEITKRRYAQTGLNILWDQMIFLSANSQQ